MRHERRIWVVAVAGLVGGLVGLLGVSPAEAVDYRLDVASMWDTGFVSFLRPGEIKDGASGSGLDRLEASLDAGGVPSGPLLVDRTVEGVGERVAQAWGAARVVAQVTRGGDGGQIWDEVRWQGRPGERSVWLVAPAGRGRPQELFRVALRGEGPMRYYTPYVPVDGQKLPVARFPLNFLWFHEERSTLWEKYASKNLDLAAGIGVVVGQNPNRSFPDQVYLVVRQGAEPATYKAVLGWRLPETEQEAPGTRSPIVR